MDIGPLLAAAALGAVGAFWLERLQSVPRGCGALALGCFLLAMSFAVWIVIHVRFV